MPSTRMPSGIKIGGIYTLGQLEEMGIQKHPGYDCLFYSEDRWNENYLFFPRGKRLELGLIYSVKNRLIRFKSAQ